MGFSCHESRCLSARPRENQNKSFFLSPFANPIVFKWNPNSPHSLPLFQIFLPLLQWGSPRTPWARPQYGQTQFVPLRALAMEVMPPVMPTYENRPVSGPI